MKVRCLPGLVTRGAWLIVSVKAGVAAEPTLFVAVMVNRWEPGAGVPASALGPAVAPDTGEVALP